MPKPRPGKILCLGRNYRDHAREMGQAELPADWRPLLFLKPSTALAEEPGTVLLPHWSQEVHHEVELVVELGAPLRRAGTKEARQAIAGYRVGLDLTARDVQRQAKERGWPWTLAKGFDGAAPVSALCRPEQCSQDPLASRIWLELDGVLRQEGRTSDMLLGVPETLSWLSSLLTLEAGDMIFSGTPAGVGPLRPGQRLRCGVEGVASLELEVREEDGFGARA